MQVRTISPVTSLAPAANVTMGTLTAPAAAPANARADRPARLEAIRTEMLSPVQFTARSHHGWGGPDPVDPPTAPTTPPATPTEPAPATPGGA